MAKNPSPLDFTPTETFRTIADKIEQPDKFAQVFCDAAKSQKNIEITLQEIVRNLLEHDKKTLDLLRKVQKQVNDEDWKIFVKRLGWSGWSLIIYILGIITTALITKFIR